MGRLMLARMKTLEESFADVVREVQLMRSGVPTAQNSTDDGSSRRGSGVSSPQVNSSVLASKDFTRKIRGQRESRPGSFQEKKVGMGGAVSPRKQGRKEKGKAKYDNTESTNEPTETFMRRGSSL
jgi:hypothetical protein